MRPLHFTEKPGTNSTHVQSIMAAKNGSVHKKENIPAEIADSTLACQALAGNERGFEQLVHRYSKPLFTFIYHILRDREQSNDVLQKVFLKFYLSLPELKLNQSFKPWLFQVAYHYCIDEFRVRNRNPTIFFSEFPTLSDENELSPVETFPDPDPLPEEVAEEHDLQRQFLLALQALPANYRSIVLLRYVAQLKFSEISQILDVPITTAKTYFHRSKPQLRRALEKSLS